MEGNLREQSHKSYTYTRINDFLYLFVCSIRQIGQGPTRVSEHFNI